MAIEFTSKLVDDTFVITSNGKDESMQEVMQYITSVIKASFQIKKIKYLIDERNLHYRSSISDIYKLAEFISQNVPKSVYIAIVPNPEGFEDLSFLETIVSEYGLNMKSCLSIEEAKEWLNHKDSINVEIKINQDLLIIKASGVESNLKDSEKYISTIIQTAIDTKCKNILCDERDLEYDFEYEYALEIVELIKQYAPTVGKTAVVCNLKYEDEIKKFKEKIQISRDDLHFFTDYDEAYAWVIK